MENLNIDILRLEGEWAGYARHAQMNALLGDSPEIASFNEKVRDF